LYFSNISQAFTGAHYGTGSRDRIVYGLTCTGTEGDVLQCGGSWVQTVSSYCSYSNAAGVNCGGLYTWPYNRVLFVSDWCRTSVHLNVVFAEKRYEGPGRKT